MRALIVEDESEFARLLRTGLRHHGILVDIVGRGDDALREATEQAYDVICLDVNLPGMDGFDACAGLRRAGVMTPVLMLTARDAIEDRIRGLDTGADDYLVKPFNLGELVARLRALARRAPAMQTDEIQVGDLRLEPRARRVYRGVSEVRLSVKELQVLEVFMRRPGDVLTREDILQGAWDGSFAQRSNVVDVYVRTLREKLDRPFGRASFETVRGAGYRLRSPGGEPG